MIATNFHAQSIISTPTGSQTIVQPTGTSLNLNIFNGIEYSNNYSTLQQAVTAACNGTIPGSVIVPPGSFVASGFTTIPSNCTITGQGAQTVVYSLTTTGSNIKVDNLSITNNRASGIDCFDIGGSASNIIIERVVVQNCGNQGVLVGGNNSHITIRNGEVYNAGRAISGEQGTAGITINGGSSNHIDIINETIHDSSGGVLVVNTGTPGSDMSGIRVIESSIYSNAFDAILITTANTNGGNIVGVQIENNEIYCNGWPASGAGFSPNCTAGFLQSGSSASGSGVGVDFIQQQNASVLRPIISGNNIHDNTYEAVAASTNINPLVSTNGTLVTWVSGTKFNPLWVSGQYVIINGMAYQIASIVNSTSLNLTTSAGMQTNVSTNMPAYMGAIISNNQSYRNGGGNSAGMGMGVGPGFYNELSDGNVYSSNIAESAWLDGYISFFSSFISYNGDKALSNGLGGVANNQAGFNNVGGFEVSYNGVTVGTHNTANPTGFYIAQSQNTNIYALSNHATVLLMDTGTNTTRTKAAGQR